MRKHDKCIECKERDKTIHSKYFCEDCLVEFISVEKHANDLERLEDELDELRKGEDTYLFVIRRQRAEIERLRKAISWGVSCVGCSNQLAEEWEIIEGSFVCRECIEYGGDSE